MLSLAISPCPNDTFIFGAMKDRYRVVLDDVEALNRGADAGAFDIVKISVAAYGRIRDRYALLRAGGAAGFGVGPLLVAARDRAPGGRIAIPGERTTAALLLTLLGEFETVPMRFDRIEDAVLAAPLRPLLAAVGAGALRDQPEPVDPGLRLEHLGACLRVPPLDEVDLLAERVEPSALADVHEQRDLVVGCALRDRSETTSEGCARHRSRARRPNSPWQRGR